MLADILSDYIAQRENFLTAIDARIKMVFAVPAILVCVNATQSYTGLLLCALMLTSMRGAGVPFMLIGMRMVAALSVVFFVVVVQVFMQGTTPLFQVALFNYVLVGYVEGLSAGLLIASKVCGAVSVIIFLSVTTPVYKLLYAASFFRVPRVFVEVAVLSYRYLFVLFEDAMTVMNAQKVRLGYVGYWRSLRSFGQLAGTVVIRAYDQSIATYNAMCVRGYSDARVVRHAHIPFNVRDWCALLIGVGVCAALLLLERVVS